MPLNWYVTEYIILQIIRHVEHIIVSLTSLKQKTDISDEMMNKK